jgi:hypothetical protein
MASSGDDRRTGLPEDWVDLLLESIVVGFATYFVSYLLSYHDLNSEFGDVFASMSVKPFRSGSRFEYRYLIPLLGWLLGFRGRDYEALSIIGGLLFNSLIYAWSARFYRRRMIAILLTLSIAFLSPNEFNYVAPSRSDIFCYVWLLSAMLWPLAAPLFVFLGLSTHEFFLIYIPWLYLYFYCFNREVAYGTSRAHFRAFLGLVAALCAYGAVRWKIAALNDFSVQYSVGYYWHLLKSDPLSQWRIQPVALGALVSLKLFWCVLVFGVVTQLRTAAKTAAFVALLVTPAVSAFATLFVAHDTSRFLGHAFPFILLLPLALSRATVWLPIVFVLNFSIPSFYFGADWYVPCNCYSQLFVPWVQQHFYPEGNYQPFWNR